MSDKVSSKDLDFVRIDEGLIGRAIGVLKALQMHGLKAISAESCTGGLVSTVLSEAPGAAEHFEGGFVVYTPEQKVLSLRIARPLIEQHGTVSREVAVAMADGALKTSIADIAVSVTGVAGPEPDEKGNPVGLVYFGCARRGAQSFYEKREFGDRGRSHIRYAAAAEALTIMERCADGSLPMVERHGDDNDRE